MLFPAGLITAVLSGSGGAAPGQASTQAHGRADLCPDSGAGASSTMHCSGTSDDMLRWDGAWSGQLAGGLVEDGDEAAVDDLAADLLAALLQLPASGPLVLRAAARQLLTCKEDAVQPTDTNRQASWRAQTNQRLRR